MCPIPQQQKILVTDDEKAMADAIAARLILYGFNVLVAYDGVEALKKVREENPSLIILDIMMPGVDGFEVCRQLKTDPDTQHIPILMLTARGQEINKALAFNCGADGYLIKPVEAETLKSRVEEFLEISKSGSYRHSISPSVLLLTPELLQPVQTEYHQTADLKEEEYVISTAAEFVMAAPRLNNILNDFHFKGKKLLGSIPKHTTKLLSLTKDEVDNLKARIPGLIVEPNIRYKMFRHPALENFLEKFQEMHSFATDSFGAAKTITVRVKGNPKPLKDVDVYLLVDQINYVGFKGITDSNGECRFTVPASVESFGLIILPPPTSYWSRRYKDIAIDHIFEAELRPLPIDSKIYDWGHLFAKMEDGLGNGGAGVKIGVIDSGISSSHSDLKPAGGHNCIKDEDPSLWDQDDDGHGSHVAGIIAALLTGKGVKGYAPKAEIYSYRVLAKDAPGPTNFDIVTAIHKAVGDGCDILNMSFGSQFSQETLLQAIQFAYNSGVLCIAAAGNESEESVKYPAAFSEVLGVGAFGKFGSYPEDSLHKDAESDKCSTDGGYFIADFSNSGSNLDLCAPGVAIISTVHDGYSAWDGTSMASPQVCGMAALALASDPELLSAERSSKRSKKLLELLKSRAKPLGFGVDYEGAGCLTLRDLLDRSLDLETVSAAPVKERPSAPPHGTQTEEQPTLDLETILASASAAKKKLSASPQDTHTEEQPIRKEESETIKETSPTPDVKGKRYLVVFPDSGSYETAQSLKLEYGRTVVKSEKRRFISVGSFIDPEADPEAAKRLESELESFKERFGAEIMEDYQYDLDVNDNFHIDESEYEMPDDESKPSLDDVLKIIEAEEAWLLSRGREVAIAIIDTGIDGGRPEFPISKHAGKWARDGDDAWTDMDPRGHGTMVACIAAATRAKGGSFDGVAPDASIISCKTDRTTSELTLIYDYLTELAEEGLKIVAVNSFGWRLGFAPDYSPGSKCLLDAMDKAIKAGVKIIFSAGNNHENVNGRSDKCRPNSIWLYKCRLDVMTVASSRLDGKMWHYSSRGPGQFFGEPQTNRKPDVTAPTPEYGRILRKGGIRVMRNGWGTSGAAPQCAGLAALMWAADPTLTTERLFDTIRNTSSPLGHCPYCEGHGLINCKNALLAVTQMASNPAAPR